MERNILLWYAKTSNGYEIAFCKKGEEKNGNIPASEVFVRYLDYHVHASSIHDSGVIDFSDHQGNHIQREVKIPFSEFVKLETEILTDYINSKNF